MSDTDQDYVYRRELDREQYAIMENKGRGLGLMGEWYGDPDWYGGQVQQIARLKSDGPTFTPYVCLEPLEKTRSNRFARFLGSRRILQIRVSKDLLMRETSKIREFLCQKFILCGRVYVPFHATENSIYMLETDENWERIPDKSCGDQYRMSFGEFVAWHNPLDLNCNQVCSVHLLL